MLLELFSSTFKDIWEGVAGNRAPHPWTQLYFPPLLFSISCSPGQTTAWVYQLLPENYLLVLGGQPTKITCWGHFLQVMGQTWDQCWEIPRKGPESERSWEGFYHTEISCQSAHFCWFQKGLDGAKMVEFFPAFTDWESQSLVKRVVSGRIYLHGILGSSLPASFLLAHKGNHE